MDEIHLYIILYNIYISVIIWLWLNQMNGVGWSRSNLVPNKAVIAFKFSFSFSNFSWGISSSSDSEVIVPVASYDLEYL